jgi:hypothetical protein
MYFCFWFIAQTLAAALGGFRRWLVLIRVHSLLAGQSFTTPWKSKHKRRRGLLNCKFSSPWFSMRFTYESAEYEFPHCVQLLWMCASAVLDSHYRKINSLNVVSKRSTQNRALCAPTICAQFHDLSLLLCVLQAQTLIYLLHQLRTM